MTGRIVTDLLAAFFIIGIPSYIWFFDMPWNNTKEKRQRGR